MEKIIAPVSYVLVSLIITIGALHGTGTLNPIQNYATVNYDGGYQKIGVISSEDVYSEIHIELRGQKLMNGNVKEALAWLQKNSGETPEHGNTITYKAGLTITAEAGISWIGSESRFKLTTHSVNLISTNQLPLTPESVTQSLKSMLAKAKAERSTNAMQALTYGPAPSESFLLTKLLAAIAD